jgi:hypothetical protein
MSGHEKVLRDYPGVLPREVEVAIDAVLAELDAERASTQVALDREHSEQMSRYDWQDRAKRAEAKLAEAERMVQMMQRIAEDVLSDPVKYDEITPEMVRDAFIKRWNALLADVAEWKRIAYAETKSNACVWQAKCEQAEAKLAEAQAEIERTVVLRRRPPEETISILSTKLAESTGRIAELEKHIEAAETHSRNHHIEACESCAACTCERDEALDKVAEARAGLLRYELLKRAVNESGDCTDPEHGPNCACHASVMLEDRQQRIAELTEALEEISEGTGAFSRDPLTHATNCIGAMKACAFRALKRASAETDKPEPA